jgi:hypothetical protein
MEKQRVTCEEFQIVSLDLDLHGERSDLQEVVREHLRECPQCAAFQRSWADLRTDLRVLGAETDAAGASSRVEMRLRQEFRNSSKGGKIRRTAEIATWVLAAAAVLVGILGWIDWYHEKHPQLGRNVDVSSPTSSAVLKSSSRIMPAGPELGEVLLASNNSDEFTLLPGSMPGFLGDATVVHVQMQRAALGSLGLTVNEEHAGDWIQVDLLLGDDGQPQAVRLPQTAD